MSRWLRFKHAVRRSIVGISCGGDALDLAHTPPADDLAPPQGQLKFHFGSRGNEPGQLFKPLGIAVWDEQLYLADSENDRISVHELDGTYVRHFGSSTTDPDQQLHKPVAVAASDGMIFVTELEGRRISVFRASDGLFIRKWKAKGKKGGRASMRGIAVSNGFLYVCETNRSFISVYRVDGTFVTQFGSYGVDPGQLRVPIGIALNAGFVFVAELGNSRISVFRLNGTFVRHIGVQDHSLRHPVGVASMGDWLAVCDFYSLKIHLFTLDGTFLQCWHTNDRRSPCTRLLAAVNLVPPPLRFQQHPPRRPGTGVSMWTARLREVDEVLRSDADLPDELIDLVLPYVLDGGLYITDSSNDRVVVCS